MGPRIIFKILLIILLILLATPLLGALAMMASGGGAMAQIPAAMNGRMIGLAVIWIALILVLIVVAIVWIGRSMQAIIEADAGRAERGGREKTGDKPDKAA
jgi:hypothetical protein